MAASAEMIERAAQRVLDEERAAFGGKKLPAAVADLKPELREHLMTGARLAVEAPDLATAAKLLYGAVRGHRPAWEKLAEPSREWFRRRARVARGEVETSRGAEAPATLF